MCALVPPLPGALGKLVSVNQIRRLPFLEMPWLLVALGAAGLVVLLRRRALAVGLVAGIVLGVAVPRALHVETVAAVVACTASVAGLGVAPAARRVAAGARRARGWWRRAGGAVGARRGAPDLARARRRPAAGPELRSRPARSGRCGRCRSSRWSRPSRSRRCC